MFQKKTEPVHQDLFRQLQIAEALSSVSTRLGGLCTLLALAAWVWGGLFAHREATKMLVLANLNMYMEYHYQTTASNDGEVESQPATSESSSPQDHLKKLQRNQLVQFIVIGLWTLLMILAGVFMLCAALAGLSGSWQS